MTSELSSPDLATRLEKLEQQLGRMSDLLAEQSSRRKRRRLLTIRLLLLIVALFAVAFTWAGRIYTESRRQAHAVSNLVGQGVFVLHEPRRSVLVSMLPGDTDQPPSALMDLLGEDFFRSVTNVSTGPKSDLPRDKTKILSALQELPHLERLRLLNMQLRSDDLAVLAGCRQLQSLDVMHTGLDSGAMPWLRELPLRWFNASHTQFGDRALANLAHCDQLQELRLERSCVTDAGLQHLLAMPHLRYVDLKRSPVTVAAVKKLADAKPGCLILWEPLIFDADGQVNAKASRRGRMQFGIKRPPDPRIHHRAVPPLDAYPANHPNSAWAPWNLNLPVYRSPG